MQTEDPYDGPAWFVRWREHWTYIACVGFPIMLLAIPITCVVWSFYKIRYWCKK